MILTNLLVGVPMSELSPDRIIETGLAFWTSKVLLSALELDLFSELGQQPGNLNEISQRVGLHARGAKDFLDSLVALRFLDRIDGVYHNTPETACFLDRNKSSYIGGILEHANIELYPVWEKLTSALKTGKPQHAIQDTENDIFFSLYENDEKIARFMRAMSGYSRASNDCIARQFPWSEYQSFVDVGAAGGDLAVQIASTHPHLNGIGFDLEEVAPCFQKNIASNQLEERLYFVAGDFFSDPLPETDVILMGHILHDWDMEKKRLLLKKAYEALPAGGVLVVYESLIDDDRCENSLGLLMSLNMLVRTQGGFDFTGSDCCLWMKEAGFRNPRVEQLQGSDSMVVAVK